MGYEKRKEEEGKRWNVYTITRIESRPNDKDAKAYWNLLGQAFENRDGSINILLFGLPINGKLQLRIPKENDR